MLALKDINPMKSTWRTSGRDGWTFSHWFLDTIRAHPTTLGQHIPKHNKHDKVPYLSQFSAQRWILVHACIPLALEAFLVRYIGRNLQAIELYGLYSIPFSLTLIRQVHALRHLGHQHGFFDGDSYPRDQIPDVAVHRVAFTMVKMAIFRLGVPLYLTYHPSASPKLAFPWLPLYIGLYILVLDFLYYWCHRATHEIDFLWSTHALHHRTKHPTSPLAAYADETENLITMTGAPVLSYFVLRQLGLHLTFHDWWMCCAYVTFTEILQHSGVRMHASAPSPLVWVLQYFDVDLATEDHDLHHRTGWKRAFNYGKQSRLWDRLFGTGRKRVEGVKGNVDYQTRVEIPLI